MFGPAYAAKLFADLGADVISIDGDEDVVRSRPHDVHRWLNTNKRSVTWAAGLAADADLVIHDLGPARAATRGVTHSQLADRQPPPGRAVDHAVRHDRPLRRLRRRGTQRHAREQLGVPVPRRGVRPAASPAQGSRPPRHHHHRCGRCSSRLGGVRAGRPHRNRRPRGLLGVRRRRQVDRDLPGGVPLSGQRRLPAGREDRGAVEHLPVRRRTAPVHLRRADPVGVARRADGQPGVGVVGGVRHQRGPARERRPHRAVRVGVDGDPDRPRRLRAGPAGPRLRVAGQHDVPARSRRPVHRAGLLRSRTRWPEAGRARVPDRPGVVGVAGRRAQRRPARRAGLGSATGTAATR